MGLRKGCTKPAHIQITAKVVLVPGPPEGFRVQGSVRSPHHQSSLQMKLALARFDIVLQTHRETTMFLAPADA